MTSLASHTDVEYEVWWIPQVPMEPFTFAVPDFETGLLFLDVLAKYDLFQLEKRVKPDYSNTGGLRYRFVDRHNPNAEPGEWEEIDDGDEYDVIEHRQRIADAGCDLIWTVDHNDDVPVGGRVNLIAKVQSERLAQALIAGIQQYDPNGVDAGEYGICGPQEDA